MSENQSGLRTRGEEAIGEIAQALLENPVFSQGLARALSAGEKAVQAQRSALGAFDVAVGSDLQRLSRRMRALTERIDELEDEVDRLRGELAGKADVKSRAKPKK